MRVDEKLPLHDQRSPPLEAAVTLEGPSIKEVLSAYEREHVPHTANPDIAVYRIRSLSAWWSGARDSVTCISTSNCRAYAAHRKAESIRKVEAREVVKARRQRRPADLAAARAARPGGSAGARGDLEVLRAAVNYWHREKAPLSKIPAVWLPQKPAAREQWLTRSQISRFLWAARRTVENLQVDPAMPPRLVRRLCRFILLAFYSGSRSGVVFGTRYSLLDFENDYMLRKPRGARRSKKQAPPHRMPKRLKVWLLRWKRIDGGLTDYVVHRGGVRIEKMRKAWDGARELAGLPEDVTPHTLRHSRATHLMRNRKVANEDAAQFMGMTLQTFIDTYGHHDPDWQRDAADAR